MLIIGITGGIGSGKTTVCKVFEVLGIPIFYADDAAKLVMHSDNLLKQEMINNFGAAAYSETGALNRKYIAEIVFNDDVQLKKLNSLVHPAVFRAFDVWVKSQKNVPYVIKEAALLFESGSYKDCSFSILVTSPVELRVQRIMQRDGVSRQQVLSRMSKQLSDEEKEQLADFVLSNDEKQLLVPQIVNLHQNFLKQSRQSR